MNIQQYLQPGASQYGEAPSTGSPIPGTPQAADPQDRSDLARVLSRLVLLERDLSRARHRIQQLETSIGLIEQRINSRLS